MAGVRKAADEQIVEAYERNGSVWKAAQELGMCGQSVHERLVKLGLSRHINVFSKEDEEYLAERYVLYRDAGKLQDLADEMGRTKNFICRKARDLGLTDLHYSRDGMKNGLSEMPIGVAAPIWNDFKKSRYGVTEFCHKRHYNIQSFVDAMNRFFPEEYDIVVESKGDRDSKRAKGMEFEFNVQKDLKAHGYFAIRSPASKSPADVYAFRFGEMLFVQCKLSLVFPPEEWNHFLDYSRSVGAVPLAATSADDVGIEYHKLLDYKIPGDNQQKQPCETWVPPDGNAND